MSADNALYYRQIGAFWYLKHGFASDRYPDSHYLECGEKFSTLEECLKAAHKQAESYSVLEYGVCEDPGPLPTYAELQSRLDAAEKLLIRQGEFIAGTICKHESPKLSSCTRCKLKDDYVAYRTASKSGGGA